MLGVFVVAVDGACVFPEFGFEVTTRSGNVLSNDVGGALSPYAAEPEQIAAEQFDVEGDIPCGDEGCHYCNSFCDGDGASGNAFVTPAITRGWSNTSVKALFDSLADQANREALGTVARGTVEDYTNQPLGTPDAISEEAIELAALAAEVDDCSREFFNALCDFDGAQSDAAKTNTSADIVGEHLDDAFSYLELAKTAFARAKRIALP
jgi:hypothetical protein